MDEPFSNLDVNLRERLATDVRAVLKATGTTAVLVTHDQNEAFALSDCIGVLNDARLQQWGSALELYHEPVNRFVAGFIGEAAFLPGTLLAHQRIATELGTFPLSSTVHPGAASWELMVRPDDIQHDDASPQQAKVVAKAFRGSQFFYTLALPSGQKVYSLVPSHHDHGIGEHIGIRVELDHVVCFGH
jgi:iron(III) transport system ATP-binding protein